jgi:hypothetical protein
VALADDSSPAYDDGSDGNFAFSLGLSSLPEGFLHVSFVFFHIHKGK